MYREMYREMYRDMHRDRPRAAGRGAAPRRKPGDDPMNRELAFRNATRCTATRRTQEQRFLVELYIS